MASALPDTLTPDILSLTPDTKSYLVPVKPVWGRLFSTMLYMNSIDLDKSTYKLGRGEDCDIIIQAEKFPNNRITNISKAHFVINKDLDSPAYITDLSKNGTYINSVPIGRGKTNILQHNDEISIGFKGLKVFVFKCIESADETYLPPELRNRYEVSRLLGKGACGEVKLIYEKSTCIQYALKKITKSRRSTKEYSVNHPRQIQNEINILQSLAHPCIIGVKEITETDTHVFIIMDYMEGGELTNFIVSPEPMSEDTIKFLFYQMIVALDYLHGEGVTHRDLKPENVLLKSDRHDSIIKLSDFGLSKILYEETQMQTMCGTINYVAPEILDPKFTFYNNMVDVWSLGVILYYMIAQELPFRSTENSILTKKILNGSFNMDGENWFRVSGNLKDLLRKILTVNPNNRIKIQDILKHPWLAEDTRTLTKVQTALYNEMKTFVIQPESDDDGDSTITENPPKRYKL